MCSYPKFGIKVKAVLLGTTNAVEFYQCFCYDSSVEKHLRKQILTLFEGGYSSQT